MESWAFRLRTPQKRIRKMLTLILLVGCKVTHFSCTIQIIKDKVKNVTGKCLL